MKTLSMFFIVFVVLLQSSKSQAKAILCPASDSADAKEIPFANNIVGLQNAVITDSTGQIISYQQGERLPVNSRIKSTATTVKVITDAGQIITLAPNSEIRVVHENVNPKNKNCLTTFELMSGVATFEGGHTSLKKCLGKAYDQTAELVGDIDIMPIGTKYTVDMNEVVAEMNGEAADASAKITTENNFKSKTVKVEKGTIAIKLKKYKPGKTANYVDEVYNDETVFVKSRSKVKTKKGKKDRVADVEVVYPQD